MNIITVCTPKGGTGKTTISYYLIEYYRSVLGKNVLAIDLDYQANLSSMYDVQPVPLNEYINGTIYELDKLAIAPPTHEQNALNNYLSDRLDRNTFIKDFINAMDTSVYDVCIIDSPPAINPIVVNWLIVSNKVLIPCTPDAFGYDATNKMIEFINDVRSINSSIEARILINAYVKNRKMQDSIKKDIEALSNYTGVVIPNRQGIADSILHKKINWNNEIKEIYNKIIKEL